MTAVYTALSGALPPGGPRELMKQMTTYHDRWTAMTQTKPKVQQKWLRSTTLYELHPNHHIAQHGYIYIYIYSYIDCSLLAMVLFRFAQYVRVKTNKSIQI